MTTALEGVRGQRHAQAALYPRERPGAHCTGGWVGPGLVWTVAENLAPTIPSPERPTCSQSLYLLSYPAHIYRCENLKSHPDLPPPLRNTFIFQPCHFVQILNSV